MVQMDGGFYTGYRRNILAPDEILVSISVPYTEEDEHFVAFKQAKRRDDDIAIVNSAFFFKLFCWLCSFLSLPLDLRG